MRNLISDIRTFEKFDSYMIIRKYLAYRKCISNLCNWNLLEDILYLWTFIYDELRNIR
jgi:hypothetical protein